MYTLLLALTPLLGGPTATEVDELFASDPELGLRFGYALALDGDTAVIGARDDDNAGGEDAGAIYVFERAVDGSWQEARKITASAPAPFDEFGISVAISGDTILVGAHLDAHSGFGTAGSAYVYERNAGGPGVWGEVAWLTASDANGFERFGGAVDLSGDTAIIGARRDAVTVVRAGSAYVFERDEGGPGAWGEVTKLTDPTPGLRAEFGSAVAIDGDTLVVGCIKDSLLAGPSTGEGSVFVYDRDLGGANAWGEVTRLLASDGLPLDEFGGSVAFNGSAIVVGAAGEDFPSFSSGAVYVFERSGGPAGPWGEVGKLEASDGRGGERFGRAVAVVGSTIAVGAHRHRSSNAVPVAKPEGSAYLFGRDANSPEWTESAKLTASNMSWGDLFGVAVALSPCELFVGAIGVDVTVGQVGAVYVFALSMDAVNYCTAGLSASGCRATLSAAGTASATAATGFELIASGVEGVKDALFFYGTNGRQTSSWGNGTSYVCVVPPRWRGGLLAGTGTAGACNGSFTQDLNARWCPSCPKPAHNPGPGATMQAQLWYRDPLSSSNQTSSMSDAIEFCVDP